MGDSRGNKSREDGVVNCQPNLHDAAFPTRRLTASATYACSQLAKSSTEPFWVLAH